MRVHQWRDLLEFSGVSFVGQAVKADADRHYSVERSPVRLREPRGEANFERGRYFEAVRDYHWGLKNFVKEARALAQFKHPHIVQRSQGAMGGSFNTREFFHGKSDAFLRTIKPAFLLLAFVIPLALLVFGMFTPALLGVAFILQYIGLLVERWLFFAQASHPQNLYYQWIS